MEHHRRRHHLFLGRQVCRRARSKGDVGISGGVDDPLGTNGFAARFGLGDDPNDAGAVHDRRDELAVQHRVDTGLFDHPIGDDLKAFRIDLVRQRLTLGNGRARLGGTCLELAPDAVRFDSLLMAIPRKAFDADRGDVATEAPESFDERDIDTSAGGGQRRGQPGRARADNQHVGLVDHIDLTRRFGDGAEPWATRGTGHLSPVLSKVCNAGRLRSSNPAELG